jgi:polyphosphate kinase 2 (PPK2 family)
MQMNIKSKDFRVHPGANVKLDKWPTTLKPFCKSKKRYEKLLEEHVEALSVLQQLHYASHRYALLLIFQGMDASGKDGAIRHVMSGVNPQGCEVFSFKQPTADELEHDFLWRTNRHLPERGRIGIFNRSYYEEVLVVRVYQKFSAVRGCRKSCATKKASGRSGIGPLRIWSSTCIATAPEHFQFAPRPLHPQIGHVGKHDGRMTKPLT